MLGSGSYGDVRSEWDQSRSCLVAIKTFKKKKVGHGVLEDFTSVCVIREVISLQRAQSHPNVARYLSFHKEGGSFHLKMGLMSCDLKRRYMMDHPLDFYRLASQLLSAVSHMHSLSLFHRDIKPQNILVSDQDDSIQVTDFGQARFIMKRGFCYTRGAGTLWYRSPEDLLGMDGLYDEKIDIWAVACTLSEVLHKVPAFCCDTEVEMLLDVCKRCGKYQFDGMCGSGFLPNIPKSVASSDQGDGVVTSTEVALLECLLVVNPSKRLTAEASLLLLERMRIAKPREGWEWAIGEGGKMTTKTTKRKARDSDDEASLRKGECGDDERLSIPKEILSTRQGVVAWMQEVYRMLELRLITFFTAVEVADAAYSLIDSSLVAKGRKGMLLWGSVSLWIASKVFETWTPLSTDFCTASGGQISTDEMVEMEDLFITTLDLPPLFVRHLSLEEETRSSSEHLRRIEHFALGTSRLLPSWKIETRDLILLCRDYSSWIQRRQFSRSSKVTANVFRNGMRQCLRMLCALHSCCASSRLLFAYELEKNLFSLPFSATSYAVDDVETRV